MAALREGSLSTTRYSLPTPPKSKKFFQLSNPPYELHQAVFSDDLATVKEIVSDAKDVVNVTDKHGKQPLGYVYWLVYHRVRALSCSSYLNRKHSTPFGGHARPQGCVCVFVFTRVFLLTNESLCIINFSVISRINSYLLLLLLHASHCLLPA